jgi:four helix bundle protein
VPNNILKDKSYAFAIKIVKTSEQLISERKEFVLAKQILKSGTAIGALIREAEFAQSKADFLNKMSIALKEANETIYWLSLLKDVGYLKEESFTDLSANCKELISLLVATVKTAKSNL